MVDAGKIAYVFPGQGSQKVGMGHDLFDSFKSARDVFTQADETLGFSLSRLCFEGPEDELKQTINTQPALVTVSLACYQAAMELYGKENVPAPAFLAGHSLGEYTALAISGVLDYSSAIYLARERGRLMQEAGEKNPGGMAAILGLDENTVASICKETGTWMANFNCPGQIVISGDKTSIEKAITLAISKGAIRALPLQVSGAFHSPLMQPASQGLETIINKLTFREPA
ncbi:MAG: ACP S-malonyltransferase, partial [Dehalococcoidales bacterium]|nr:ACP S-malonyltransferase [Dehalococcoidales bacterium]